MTGGEIGRVAVTGAAGSLGEALLVRLAKSAQVQSIVGIDRRRPAQPQQGVEYVEADVRDPEIGQVLDGCGAVIHLAFIVERGGRDPQLVQSVNVDGTRNVVKAALASGVDRIVYASSIASYGAHADNVGRELTEADPIRGNADFYYPRTKAEVEHFLDEIEPAHPGVAIARLRPSLFLSERSRDRPTRLLRSRLLVHFAGSRNPIHVTHQDDVADAFMLALTRRARGAYNLATRDPLPVADWGREVGSLSLPLPAQTVALIDAAYRRGWTDIDARGWARFSAYPIVVSSDKARSQLGWTPRWETTAEVLRQLVGRPRPLGEQRTLPARLLARLFGQA
jgi:nucleoside-diphosphate-sugar epimerase